jgi:hypothetical protein
VKEPDVSRKGDLARNIKALADHFKLKLNDEEQKLFDEWAEIDPIDLYECNLNDLMTLASEIPNYHTFPFCKALVEDLEKKESMKYAAEKEVEGCKTVTYNQKVFKITDEDEEYFDDEEDFDEEKEEEK